MRRYFNRPFRADVAAGLYQMYKDSGSGEILNELVGELLPLIRWASLKFFRNCGADRGYLEANAVQALVSSIRQRDPPDEADRLKRYLFTVARRSFIATNKWLHPKEIDLSSQGYDSFPFAGRLPTHRDVEVKIYREQLLEATRRFVKEKVHFTRIEREACIEIAERMISGSEVRNEELCRKYALGRSKLRVLREHATLLVRWGMSEVREADDDDS